MSRSQWEYLLFASDCWWLRVMAIRKHIFLSILTPNRTMFVKSIAFLVTLGVILCSFNGTMANFQRMEAARLSARSDVHVIGPADDNAIHEVCFAIKQRNMDKLTKIVEDISFPDSPSYGQHWSRQQVADFTSNPAAVQALKDHLSKQSKDIQIVRETIYGDYVFARASVKTWETLFNTEFKEYLITEWGASVIDGKVDANYKGSAKKIIRASSYDLPSALVDSVSAVFNTVQFPMFHGDGAKPKLSKKAVSAARTAHAAGVEARKTTESNGKLEYVHFGLEPTAVSASLLRGTNAKPATSSVIPTGVPDDDGILYDYVTPELIRQYYNVTVAQGDSSVQQCIYESLDDAMNPSDLTIFQQTFGLLVQPIAKDIGGHISTTACNPAVYSDCTESNLDAQYIMGVAQNVPTTYWYTDDDWLTWITQAADSSTVYDVYSISYAQYEFTIAPSYGQSFDTEAIKLAAVGSTIFSSSGDDGVIGFIGRGNPSFCGYYAQFPTTSPYVTSVGGTEGPERNLPEVACISGGNIDDYTIITTGGGFSLDYPQPSWQSSVVQTYLNRVKGTSQQPYYNATESHPADDDFYGYSLNGRYTYNAQGRAYPDVSLLAHNYYVVIDGEGSPVDGTSASSPVMAAFTVLVDYELRKAGKSSLGWLNPFLYQYYSKFTRDITTGGANNCTALFGYNVTTNTLLSTCCKEGFYPAEGWDPVS